MVATSAQLAAAAWHAIEGRPLYLLAACQSNGVGLVRDIDGAGPRPWAEVRAAFEDRVRIDAVYGDPGDPLVYSVVPA
jgi:hypothetical protein